LDICSKWVGAFLIFKHFRFCFKFFNFIR
jgi:hypothetical protein